MPANTARKLPVIVFATGGDGMHKEFNISEDFNHAAAQFPSFLGEAFDDKFIVSIPSFRGQQLIIGGKAYQSEGEVSDAFDGATTDALAFLNVTLQAFRQSDENRIAIYGGSRGGNVALLASSRDKRIKKAIVVAAPSDMKALYQLYPAQFKLLFFNDLLAGRITAEEARRKFISISPIYFTKELPMVQLHHDKNDPFVPVELANELIESMTLNGKLIDSYFYDEGIHGFWIDKNYWKRVQDFIKPLTE
jgi:dipeptidyl aminopeptidase/acylaminoacyl peptidase